jgi:hypothetical protein
MKETKSEGEVPRREFLTDLLKMGTGAGVGMTLGAALVSNRERGDGNIESSAKVAAMLNNIAEQSPDILRQSIKAINPQTLELIKRAITEASNG